MTKSVSSTPNQYSIDAFFAGVGGIELGFTQTGEFRVVYANEFDKNARETYKLNNPDVNLDGRDIHDVNPNEIPYADVIMGGFPCQAFSIAGYRKGFEDDRGDLFFELLKMISSKKPRVIFIENVKNLVSHDHGNTFKVIREALAVNGYYIKWKVLNGKDYGNVPQNRERIYVVGFNNKEDYLKFDFPEPIELKKNIKDVIDFNGQYDEKYYYRDGKQPFYDQLVDSIDSQETVYQWRRKYVRENKAGVVPTLTANMGTGGHNVPLILTDSKEIRKLTPKETFNAQGYPKEFKLPDISNAQLYKQAGNSVVVPVINRIAENIVDVLNANKVEESVTEYNLFNSGRYALLFVKVNGRNEGTSYVERYSDNYDALVEYAENKDMKLLSDEEYLKLIQKKKEETFYMIEEV
ncbi:MAG TPA: DNA cytosine methyltransferase [Romboutsia timonensis]|uniref:Cytosine-specific methyltransferase n=1 Tax=Romboutsia timonensis TaxID=1776391 RepID=A0A921N2C0_9FIRM|nr:DNA cytosine methyltransferase [Ligilactobacillus salivarius]PHY95634.1 DNA (cytosine-5-)-methyltransferase [Ligilactobacillus salivarius]HJG97638.1 DNA cytosine methyltransferase [Romboutsia timonensis]